MKNLLGGSDPSLREPLSAIWASRTNLLYATKTEMIVHIGRLVWTQIKRSPVSFFLTLSSIVVSLLLFSLFLLVAVNCRETITQSTEQISVSAYFKDGTSATVAETVLSEVKKLQGVKEATYRNKSEALQFFKKLVGEDSPLLIGISEKNPLPESIELLFTVDTIQTKLYERIVNNLSQNPAIDLVKVHNGDLSEASKAMDSLRKTAIVGTTFMILVSGLLITNAIRLTVYSNREELEIMQLVGASKAYMSAPFIVEGILQGVLGSVLSLLLCAALFPWMSDLYASSPLGQLSGAGLSFLSSFSILLVVLVGAVTGALASFFATRSVKYEAAK
jgi:cell division transport system permease protein